MKLITRLMRAWLRRLRKARFFYTPLIEVFIDRAALLHNFNTFKQFSGKDVAPVLKSNAYGHGLVPIATILKNESMPFMCVDSFFEVLILRNEGVSQPILMLGKTILENILNNNLANVAFGVVCFEENRKLYNLIKKEKIFKNELDTGMNRHGVKEEEFKKIIELAKANPFIRIEGMYTHLADADTPNSQHAEKQIAYWNHLVERYQTQLPDLKYIHCAATAGVAFADKIRGNVIRLGRGLYGVNVGVRQLPLKPVLEMRTSITSLREIDAGESVGYNATYTASEKRRVASIPVGYAEGLDRRLSTKAAF